MSMFQNKIRNIYVYFTRYGMWKKLNDQHHISYFEDISNNHITAVLQIFAS